MLSLLPPQLMENPVINNPSVDATIDKVTVLLWKFPVLRVLLPLWFPPLRLLHVWFHVLPVLEILPFKP